MSGTSNVIKFPKHKTRVHENGLVICTTCNGIDGMSLPTHCPMYRMTVATEDKVCTGEMDYRRGAWVVLRATGRMES